LKENAELIRDKLCQFGIEVTMSDVHVGPTVIQYTLKPHEGVKISKITSLKSDLALALASSSIRIEAPIPGKSLVGIEVPNEQRSIVKLREIVESDEFSAVPSKLRLPLGRDVSGKPIVVDLISMPHLLIAGATGAGKSVGINSFLLSLLYQNSPADLKLIMIDPKRVELNSYNAIPHLLTPVITDVEKAAISLRWAVTEMMRRYQIFADTRHRNITDYNEDPAILEKMPRIIVLVDELADLMMAAGKEVEASICRIAQMARAVGMHLIVATQRPSVDVITGLIKANMPSRIAYAVTSGIDSRTILDSIGAEDLLGKGDMLYIGSEMSKPIRIQGVYVSTKEVERVTNRVKLTVEPEYNEEITSHQIAGQKVAGLPPSKIAAALAADGDNDALYEQALRVIIESRKASASLLQRRLEIGYARAARILDEMEENGVIGPVRGAKPREIYLDSSAVSEQTGG
ncbi:MAG: DNA translocase FtsK, partial [Patescibacteria group bacterium]